MLEWSAGGVDGQCVGELEIFFDGQDVLRCDVVVEHVCEVVVGEVIGPTEWCGVTFDDAVDVLGAGSASVVEEGGKVVEIAIAFGHPDGEDEGQAGPLVPRLAEVELMGIADGGW